MKKTTCEKFASGLIVEAPGRESCPMPPFLNVFSRKGLRATDRPDSRWIPWKSDTASDTECQSGKMISPMSGGGRSGCTKPFPRHQGHGFGSVGAM